MIGLIIVLTLILIFILCVHSQNKIARIRHLKYKVDRSCPEGYSEDEDEDNEDEQKKIK